VTIVRVELLRVPGVVLESGDEEEPTNQRVDLHIDQIEHRHWLQILGANWQVLILNINLYKNIKFDTENKGTENNLKRNEYFCNIILQQAFSL
jgi:hypothetical protein